MQHSYRHVLTSALHQAGKIFSFSKSLTIGACFTLAAVAQAQTNIKVWHAMPTAQSALFEKIVQHFNQQQKEIQVQLQAFPTQAELESAGLKALAAKNPPNLIGLSAGYSQNLLAKNAFVSMDDIFKKSGIPSQKWFLPSSLRVLKDNSGKKLMAFPWMEETPVLFYNRQQFAKAQLTVTPEENLWLKWVDHIEKLVLTGSRCPLTTSSWTAIHLEALAAMHNQPYVKGTSQVNGQSLLVNKVMFVDHIALLKTWLSARYLTKFPTAEAARSAFLDQQCAAITDGSSLWGTLQAQNKFEYGLMPLPVYKRADGSKYENNPFVWGAGLWAFKSSKAAEEKAVGTFLAYLIQPKLAGEWAAYTGYLPMTEPARAVAKQLVYDTMPDGAQIVANFARNPVENSRGFSIRNYPQVFNILESEFVAAIENTKEPLRAMNDAIQQIEKINQYKGK